MKKIILGLSIGLASVTSWSACTYNFDATQAQLDQLAPGLGLTTISGQKIELTISPTSTPKGVFGMSKAIAAKRIQLNDPGKQVEGDKSIPTQGIFAFEYKVKVPTFLLANNESILSWPGMVSGINGNDAFGIMVTYNNNFAGTYTPNGFGVGIYDKTFVLASKTLPTQNTADGYQKIGIYINQDTKKVGVIFNGVDQGYIGSFNTKVDNLSFLHDIQHTVIANNSTAIGQQLSLELITDRSKFQFTYPTGTKDICGTTL